MNKLYKSIFFVLFFYMLFRASQILSRIACFQCGRKDFVSSITRTFLECWCSNYSQSNVMHNLLLRIRTHVHTHVPTHTFQHTYTHTLSFSHTRTYIWLYACVYVCLCISIHYSKGNRALNGLKIISTYLLTRHGGNSLFLNIYF